MCAFQRTQLQGDSTISKSQSSNHLIYQQIRRIVNSNVPSKPRCVVQDAVLVFSWCRILLDKNCRVKVNEIWQQSILLNNSVHRFLKSRRLCTDHVKTRQDQNVAYQYIEVPIFFLLFYELAQPRSTPIWDKSIGTSPSVSTNQTRVNSKIRWCARFPWTVEHIPAFKMVHSMHDQAKDPGFSSSVALKMSNCTNFPTPLLYYYFIFRSPFKEIWFDGTGLFRRTPQYFTFTTAG